MEPADREKKNNEETMKRVARLRLFIRTYYITKTNRKFIEVNHRLQLQSKDGLGMQFQDVKPTTFSDPSSHWRNETNAGYIMAEFILERNSRSLEDKAVDTGIPAPSNIESCSIKYSFSLIS